jgi:hypothetical protein
MAISDDEEMMGSDIELDGLETTSKVDKGKSKATDDEPPKALEGALPGHELDNLPWYVYKLDYACMTAWDSGLSCARATP